jgi:hypothetical protein
VLQVGSFCGGKFEAVANLLQYVATARKQTNKIVAAFHQKVAQLEDACACAAGFMDVGQNIRTQHRKRRRHNKDISSESSSEASLIEDEDDSDFVDGEQTVAKKQFVHDSFLPEMSGFIVNDEEVDEEVTAELDSETDESDPNDEESAYDDSF